MGGIGKKALNEILGVSQELREHVREEFTPCEGVYRIDDCGEYVTEQDWLGVWATYPSWWQDAWLLTDNGQYSFDEVAQMTVGEIRAAVADPTFCPEHAFYTETDYLGMV